MPADCSVLCTPTILPNIRISWDIHPTFMLISGRPQGLSPTYEQAHVGLDLLTLASIHSNLAGMGKDKRMDKIKIKDLEVFANHGVFPEENTLGQKFIVSADLYTDTRKAGKTDDLTVSIHYGEVSAFIEVWLKKHTYKLLESAAENLAEELLLKYPGMRAIRLEIKKPWAPIRLPLKTVSVEIERAKHTVYIAMGSNMGDREKYIKDAVKMLDSTLR